MYADCCKRGRGELPLVSLPPLLPPSPSTNFAHPSCYMSSTNNCCQQISREHYISRVILEKFPTLQLSGLPWHKDDAPVTYPADALAAKILCKRHNEALNKLDTLAGSAFDSFVKAAEYALDHDRPGRVLHFLASGDALELWMVKVLAGIYFGGIATDGGKKMIDECEIDIVALTNALSGNGLPNNTGMLVAQTPGYVLRKSISVAPIISTKNPRAVGLHLSFGSLLFHTFIDGGYQTEIVEAKRSKRFRPGIIDFYGPCRDARIILTWKGRRTSANQIGMQIRP